MVHQVCDLKIVVPPNKSDELIRSGHVSLQRHRPTPKVRVVQSLCVPLFSACMHNLQKSGNAVLQIGMAFFYPLCERQVREDLNLEQKYREYGCPNRGWGGGGQEGG